MILPSERFLMAKWRCQYEYMGPALGPGAPPPPQWYGSKTYILATFMEPAKAHGIYNVLTSTASETVVFAALCNTTIVYYYSYSITTMYKPT